MKWLRQLSAHAAQTRWRLEAAPVLLTAVLSMTPENLAIVFCQNLLKAPLGSDPSKIMLNSERERNFIKHAIVHWPQ